MLTTTKVHLEIVDGQDQATYCLITSNSRPMFARNWSFYPGASNCKAVEILAAVMDEKVEHVKYATKNMKK